MGDRNRPPIQTIMKHYIIYTMIIMSFIYLVLGEQDRMGRGVEMKFARIEPQTKSLIS